MMATGLMLILATGYFLWRRSSWWYSTTLGSESAESCLYPWYGDNILHYYKVMTAPLSCYLFSVTLRRSIPKAREIYLLMLSAQGVFLYVTTWLLFDSAWIGLIAGVVFLLYTLFPYTFILEMEPEAHGYFFASFGLMLTALGLHFAMDWLVYGGVFVGSLCFHSKITLQDGLMTLAVIACMQGVDTLFWNACLVYLGSMALFGLLVLLGEVLKHDNDRRAFLIPSLLGKIKAIVYSIRSDLGIRYPGKSKTSVMDFLNLYVGYHARIAWPLIIMTVAAVCQGLLSDRQAMLLALLALLPVSQCMVRLNYQPGYAFMVHFPLAVGAGVFLVGNAAAIVSHPLAALLAATVAVYVVLLTVKEHDQITPFTARTKVIKDHILDPIRANVGPEDFVFQDSWMVLIYLELGCKSPNMSFLWADRIELVLKRQEDVDAFIHYFTENRPKYYIAHQKKLNLDYIERVTGLRYELRNKVYAHVYELVGIERPSGEQADIHALFDNPGARYERDLFFNRVMTMEKS